MPELKVHLSDELDNRFRKAAMNVHGYGRGSISKAATEALTNWCRDHEQVIEASPSEASQKGSEITPANEAVAQSSDPQGENREGQRPSPAGPV